MTAAIVSCLYRGAVTHCRFAPRRHRLRYRMFQMLLDLDEAPTLGRRLRWFSHERFNLLSFHERDHGDGRPGGLRAWVEATAAAAGLSAEGPIQVLCMPRLLGHVFNPLSIYFCHAADGAPSAMLYEVNNTFGQRHSYLIATAGPEAGAMRQSCPKRFHVSPFMDMDLHYHFRVTAPGESLSTGIQVTDGEGRAMLAAVFAGRRAALSDRALVGAVRDFPALTLKVVAAIHFEAVKLLLKGVRLRPAPPPPTAPVTVG